LNLNEEKYLIEIMDKMEKIQYGWIDINNEIHINTIKDLQKLYRLADIKEIIENKIGICFDQVELERFYFQDRFQVQSYAITSTHMIHTFLALQSDNDYIYFEHSSAKSKGIYYFNNMNQLLEFAIEQYMFRHKIKKTSNVKLIPYNKLEKRTTFNEILNILKENDLKHI